MELIDSNQIQIVLMEDSELDRKAWIEEYSERFRKLLEGGITKVDEFKLYLYIH